MTRRSQFSTLSVLSALARGVALPSLALALALGLSGCQTARLEPADSAQKVPNRPKAAAQDTEVGIRIQAEADVWVADERVRDEVTAMKVTLTNHGKGPVTVEYNAFSLVGDDGTVFEAVAPSDINIRGATRSIGLAPDSIITRSSDSSVNAPQRTESEKEQIRKRIEEQALEEGELPSGDRRIGYVYFRRVPANQTNVTFHGRVLDPKTGKEVASAELPFRAREHH